MNETVREVEQAHKTYFRQKAGDSAGFRRARKPYRLVNLLSMLAICTFAGGVYAYSILMVEQDDFSDLENFRVTPLVNETHAKPDSSLSQPPVSSEADRPIERHDIGTGWKDALRNRFGSLFGRSDSASASNIPNATTGPLMNKKAI